MYVPSVNGDWFYFSDLTVWGQVEGDVDRGVVQLHLVKRPGQDDYDYKYLYLDVKGMDEPCRLANGCRNHTTG